MKYSIEGENLPVAICTLSQGETMITQSGAMSWMTPNISMETEMRGGFGKAIGRSFSGESMFMNKYTCLQGEGVIAFASSFPGRILAIPISSDQGIVVQKTAFMAAELGVETEVFFTRKFSAGIFGGEGFIMQKLLGQGMAFLEIAGHVVEYDLTAGQSLLVDTGHLAAMTETVQMSIESVKGAKNKFFGGEGFFNTKVTGPGHVWIQTMPISKLVTSLGYFGS